MINEDGETSGVFDLSLLKLPTKNIPTPGFVVEMEKGTRTTGRLSISSSGALLV